MSKLHRLFYCSPVSTNKRLALLVEASAEYQCDKNFLACVKDVVTVSLMYRTYKKYYNQKRISDHRKNLMKYFIYLTAFTLEDCGQVFIQFFFYERYHTDMKTLTVVNGIFMILMSFKSVIDLAKYSVEDKHGNYK